MAATSSCALAPARRGAFLGSVAVLGLAVGFERSFWRHRAAATARLSSLDRAAVETSVGPVEFADTAPGADDAGRRPVLVSHGIFHGFDGGLTSVAGLLEGRRVVVPSRFGYLGSAMPTSGELDAARQADVFAELLDRLEIDRVDVLAISAGTSAAVQFALRHPERVAHLVLSSGNFPGSPTAQVVPDEAIFFYADRLLWFLRRFVPPAFVRLMGVPDGFPADDDQARHVEELADSIFPIRPRREGAIFDSTVTNAEVEHYPFERLAVPTLVVHAVDDPLATFDAAAAAAARIPGARLVALDSGGHLQLGQAERVRSELSDFLDASPAPVSLAS